MLKKIIYFTFLVFVIGGVLTSCAPTTKNKTQQRVEKQKKRQKKNPNDCPQIDC